MGDVAGDEAKGYYRRYTLPELVGMGFADSIEDAQANETQWKRIGGRLSDAADSLRKIMNKLPDHYQSAEGAPALLRRLGEATKKMQSYGQIALDNGTAWQGVKQSLQKAQFELATLSTVGQAATFEGVNDAADVIQRLSSEYINHANDILGPDGAFSQGYIDRRPDTGGEDTARETIEAPGPGPGGSGPGPAGGIVAPAVGSPASGVPVGPGRAGGLPPTSRGTPATNPNSGGAPRSRAASARGGPSVIGGSVGSPRGGSSFGPVGRTIGGRPGTIGGAAGGSGPVGGDSSRGGAPGRPGTPGGPPPGQGAAADPQSGRPAGGVPPGAANGGPPGSGPAGADRRRPGRRRGGPMGDPDDFRFQPDFVAPSVIQPGEERPVEDFSSTIGGKQVSNDPWSAPVEDLPRARESTSRPSPLPDGEIRMEGHNVSFKRRPRGGA